MNISHVNYYDIIIIDNNEYVFTVHIIHISNHSTTAYKLSKTGNGVILYKWDINVLI